MMMRAAWLVPMLTLATMAGCIAADDDPANKDVIEEQAPTPVYEDFAELPETITGIDLFATADVPSGSGIWLHGDFAYVGGRGDGFFVVDIADPAAPKQVGSTEHYARDVDMVHYDDGRKVAVLAGQSQGMAFIDVTDPANPTELAVISTDDLGQAVHNVAVVPGTTIVYNSPSGGGGQGNKIVDASDPTNPTIAGAWGSYGCHDSTFYINEEENKSRVYCSGVAATEILDIADPFEPKSIVVINHPVLDNGGGLHHLAIPNQDASLLLLGDEFTGGLGPGCGFHADTPVRTASSPIGALWIYDITDEENPKELSNFAPTVPAENHAMATTTSCTAHFGTFIADRPVFVIGWYAAGTIVIDLSDPENPRQVAQYSTGTDTWDARYHRGMVFTGDMLRGLDVLKLT